ncbi:unnamed protein product [Prorocentrum cordatum]|uniref:JmjC domain-containing protein n=1 Tax=Prorocentrum cordatum TaxID=2364126 RepID=A0ABN9SQR2_9DINO|nr:unnamed protein product [Polarella glacialis]
MVWWARARAAPRAAARPLRFPLASRPPPSLSVSALVRLLHAGKKQCAAPRQLAGRKRWWLWPPARAAMSRQHPARLPGAPAAELAGALEVVQEVGDILFVPSGWGHAVLNLGSYNVCVAVEFDG